MILKKHQINRRITIKSRDRFRKMMERVMLAPDTESPDSLLKPYAQWAKKDPLISEQFSFQEVIETRKEFQELAEQLSKDPEEKEKLLKVLDHVSLEPDSSINYNWKKLLLRVTTKAAVALIPLFLRVLFGEVTEKLNLEIVNQVLEHAQYLSLAVIAILIHEGIKAFIAHNEYTGKYKEITEILRKLNNIIEQIMDKIPQLRLKNQKEKLPSS